MFNNVNDLISFIQGLKRSEKKESLDYMNSLCAFFNNPEKGVKYIHIGGTNGKGSTISYLKNILMAAGYNVGCFISPYVVCFNERISYNNQYISDDDLLKYGNMIIENFPLLEANNLRTPSFFEFLTLLSFLYFKDLENLDYALCEVGIGGKLDSTNVIKPVISAVTNVSYDHMEILGHTLDEIWDNKLGIVKEKTPFVVLYNDEFIEKITKVCADKNAPLIIVKKDDVKNINVNIKNTVFDYQDFPNLILELRGFHQIENAILAIEIVKHIPNVKITRENIYQGLNHTFWPGRLEKMNDEPLILIDGAHNIDGVTRLVQYLNAVKDKPLRIVFAVSSNKDKEPMIKKLEEVADEMIFTSFSYKRHEDSQVLYDLSNHPNKKLIDDLDEIIDLCLHDHEHVTVFCGSLFLISEVRSKFIS